MNLCKEKKKEFEAKAQRKQLIFESLCDYQDTIAQAQMAVLEASTDLLRWEETTSQELVEVCTKLELGLKKLYEVIVEKKSELKPIKRNYKG